MDSNQHLSQSNNRIQSSNFFSAVDLSTNIQLIIKGLSSVPKYISNTFFYDTVGSKLFEKITKLPEYYLSKLEISLLQQFSFLQNDQLHNTTIVELGSGDCSKISVILNTIDKKAIDSICYQPLDICQDALEESANTLIKKFPELTIHYIVADYTMQIPWLPSSKKRLICFFGSTLGNMHNEERIEFLSNISRQMKREDTLLIGLDLVKSREVLEKAYNDNADITAQFNANILSVVNSIVKTDFNLNDFQHVAFFNEQQSRIEMHLQAKKQMTISSPYLTTPLKISRDEMIHTENSYKFTLPQIRKMLDSADLQIDQVIMDPQRWFALVQVSRKAG